MAPSRTASRGARKPPDKRTAALLALALDQNFGPLALQQLEPAPSRTVFQRAIQSTSGSQWRAALRLLETMPEAGHEPTAYSYNLAQTACMRGGQWRSAIELFESASVRDVATFSTAIAAHSKLGDADKALETLRAMPAAGVRPNEFSYATTISAVGAAGRWRDALSLLNEMPRAGVRANSYCYNAALAALDRGGQAAEAVKLLDRMAGAMAPDVISYTSAISSCTRVPSMFGAAMGVWERMRAAECPPNAYAYSAVLTACERAGAWEEALLLMGDMKRDQVRPNRHVFASAIGACASQGRWSDALRLLARMRVEGIAADEVCFVAALNACARGREWRKALDLLEAMERSADEEAEAMVTLGEPLLKTGAPTPMLTLTEAAALNAPPATVRAYGVALSAMHKCSQWEAAVALLRRMQTEERCPPPNLLCFTSALAACGAAVWGRGAVAPARQALALWAEMLDESTVVPDALCASYVADACASAGQWRAGLKVFDDFHRAREGAAPQEAEVGPGEMQSEELTPRQENAQLNEVCSLLDGLNRRGVPRETLSMEAAIACCEQYALGDRLVEMLKREDTQITEDLFVRGDKKPR